MTGPRYEHLSDPLASEAVFLARLSGNVLKALGLIAVSLAVGMALYHRLEGLSWIDSFANASMILSGMGPLAAMKTFAGKLFAGLYALYSGLMLIVVGGLLLTPVAHRVLHRLHGPRPAAG